MLRTVIILIFEKFLKLLHRLARVDKLFNIFSFDLIPGPHQQFLSFSIYILNISIHMIKGHCRYGIVIDILIVILFLQAEKPIGFVLIDELLSNKFLQKLKVNLCHFEVDQLQSQELTVFFLKFVDLLMDFCSLLYQHISYGVIFAQLLVE